jgi:hypothetical protein
VELTLAALGATALAEGIRFVYGQAGELLKRWRERADDEPMTPVASDALAGELAPVAPNWQHVERLGDDLRELRRRLTGYVEEGEPVDPADPELLHTVEALRRDLEVVLGQRITFKGEAREPSGPVVIVASEVDDVAGYSAGVRARRVTGGRVEVTRRTGVVRPGGEDIGLDVDEIGP